MLRLSEIAAVKATVDEDWRSAVADCVGERWGLEAGALRWWRSSGSHVFVVPEGVDGRGVLYARFAPWGTPSGRRLSAGVARHAELEGRGAAVACTVPSVQGKALEKVTTPVGAMVASVVLRVEGEGIEVDTITPEQAFAWGDALAAFHGASEPAEPWDEQGSSPFSGLVGHPDEQIAASARRLDDAHRQLPLTPWVVGHGDFELDNLRWQEGQFISFDLDDSGPMPRALDIAAATGDLLGPAGTLTHPHVLERFLDGYAARSGERVTQDDLSLARAMLAARDLAAAQGVLDLPEHDASGLGELAASLGAWVAQNRAIIISAAQAIG